MSEPRKIEAWRHRPRSGKGKRAVLEYLATHPSCTCKEIAEVRGVLYGSVLQSMKSLMGEGRVKQVGRGLYALAVQEKPPVPAPSAIDPLGRIDPGRTVGREQEFVNMLRRRQPTTIMQMAEALGWNPSIVRRIVDELQDKGVLKFLDVSRFMLTHSYQHRLNASPAEAPAEPAEPAPDDNVIELPVRREPAPARPSLSDLQHALRVLQGWVAAYDGDRNAFGAVEVALSAEHLELALTSPKFCEQTR